MFVKMNWVDWIAFILVVIGAINWGLIGFFSYNLVGSIFGGDVSTAAKVIYAIVGIAGLYLIVKAFWGSSES